MNDLTMSNGLLATTPTTPKTSDDPFKQAAKPSSPSTSKSRGAQGQPPQPKRRSESEKLQAVTDLLSGKTSDENTSLGDDDTATGNGVGPDPDGAAGDATDVAADANGGDGNEAQGVTGDLSIKDLAERLGTTPKKLYEAIQITTGDGETLTLGDVKDRITTQEAATREIVKRETAITERESAMLQNMQLIQSVYDDLKGKLDPQTIQKWQSQTSQAEARERNLMMQAMPELADAAQLETFRNDVAETMQPYGFAPHELVIRDHRIALAIKDLIQTKRQLAKLMDFQPEKMPPKSRKPQGRTKPPNRQAETIATARNSNRPQDKAAAVNAILQGANNA